MNDQLQQKLNNIPHNPGVYIFKDAAGDILYIGKANNLKNRVNQYFHNEGDGRLQIPFLMRGVCDLDYIITDTEVESLLLENNLIKKHRPKYNIKLRDDKNYAFIKIDFDCQIPYISVIRNPDSKNAKYFGPYSSAQKVRDTLQLLRKIFPYCSNKEVGTRPCFYYYLHRCPGVCVGIVSIEDYKYQTIRKIQLFLAGNISEIKKQISGQMKNASHARQFERAAGLRDQLRSLEVIEEHQKAIFTERVNWDFISQWTTADKTTVNVFAIRGGRLIDRKNFVLDNAGNTSETEIIAAFLETYYSDASDQPREIFVQALPEDTGLITKLFAKTVSFSVPKKGKKAELIELGQKNAREYFETWSMTQGTELSRTMIAAQELAKVLGLPEAPHRIECFDISNIQGTNSVASMVVFEEAIPKKSEYRKFKIKMEDGPNDFGMMREALSRRFSSRHTEAAATKNWALPDLLVIDGGKGQLGVAVEVLAACSLQIPVIGLAKREEEIFLPGAADPIVLPKSDYALQLLQRIRDEAHRFGITFHKNLRSKAAYKSVLDTIPGIGPVKKKALIKKFGSVEKIKAASSEELTALVGAKLASEIISRI